MANWQGQPGYSYPGWDPMTMAAINASHPQITQTMASQVPYYSTPQLAPQPPVSQPYAAYPTAPVYQQQAAQQMVPQSVYTPPVQQTMPYTVQTTMPYTVQPTMQYAEPPTYQPTPQYRPAPAYVPTPHPAHPAGTVPQPEGYYGNNDRRGRSRSPDREWHKGRSDRGDYRDSRRRSRSRDRDGYESVSSDGDWTGRPGDTRNSSDRQLHRSHSRDRHIDRSNSRDRFLHGGDSQNRGNSRDRQDRHLVSSDLHDDRRDRRDRRSGAVLRDDRDDDRELDDRDLRDVLTRQRYGGRDHDSSDNRDRQRSKQGDEDPQSARRRDRDRHNSDKGGDRGRQSDSAQRTRDTRDTRRSSEDRTRDTRDTRRSSEDRTRDTRDTRRSSEDRTRDSRDTRRRSEDKTKEAKSEETSGASSDIFKRLAEYKKKFNALKTEEKPAVLPIPVLVDRKPDQSQNKFSTSKPLKPDQRSQDKTSSNKRPVQSQDKTSFNKRPDQSQDKTSSNKRPDQSQEKTSSNKRPDQSQDNTASNKRPDQSQDKTSSSKKPDQNQDKQPASKPDQSQDKHPSSTRPDQCQDKHSTSKPDQKSQDNNSSSKRSDQSKDKQPASKMPDQRQDKHSTSKRPDPSPAKQTSSKRHDRSPANQDNKRPDPSPAKQDRMRPDQSPARQDNKRPDRSPVKQASNRPDQRPANQASSRPGQSPARQDRKRPVSAADKGSPQKPPQKSPTKAQHSQAKKMKVTEDTTRRPGNRNFATKKAAPPQPKKEETKEEFMKRKQEELQKNMALQRAKIVEKRKAEAEAKEPGQKKAKLSESETKIDIDDTKTDSKNSGKPKDTHDKEESSDSKETSKQTASETNNQDKKEMPRIPLKKSPRVDSSGKAANAGTDRKKENESVQTPKGKEARQTKRPSVDETPSKSSSNTKQKKTDDKEKDSKSDGKQGDEQAEVKSKESEMPKDKTVVVDDGKSTSKPTEVASEKKAVEYKIDRSEISEVLKMVFDDEEDEEMGNIVTDEMLAGDEQKDEETSDGDRIGNHPGFKFGQFSKEFNESRIGTLPGSKIDQFLLEFNKQDEPLVGLQYITEIIHLNNPKKKYNTYRCICCHCNIYGRPIVDHIIGFKHRMNYFERNFPHIFMRLKKEDKARLLMNKLALEAAQKVEQVVGRQKMVCVTGSTWGGIKKGDKTRVIPDVTVLKKEPQQDFPKPSPITVTEPVKVEHVTFTKVQAEPAAVSPAKPTDEESEMASGSGGTGANTSTNQTVVSVEVVTQPPLLTKDELLHESIRLSVEKAEAVSYEEARHRVKFYRFIQNKPDVPLLGLNEVVEISGFKEGAPIRYLCKMCKVPLIDGPRAFLEHTQTLKHQETYLERYHPRKVDVIDDIENEKQRKIGVENQARLAFMEDGRGKLLVTKLEMIKPSPPRIPVLPYTDSKDSGTSQSGVTGTSQSAAAADAANIKHADSKDVEVVLFDLLKGLDLIPIVGLNYITEIQSVDQKTRPTYHCKLCETTHSVNFINSHLTSHDHRSRFLKTNYPLLHSRTAGNKDLVFKYIKEIEGRYGRESVWVKTLMAKGPNGMSIYSEPVFVKGPWPSKAADASPTKATDNKKSSTDSPVKVATTARLADKGGNSETEFEKIIEGLDYTPFLGLQYITEIQHPDKTYTAKYECLLCHHVGNGTPLTTTNILNHISARGHRMNFFRETHEDMYKAIISCKDRAEQNTMLAKYTKEIESTIGRGAISHTVSTDLSYWTEEEDTAAQEESQTEAEESSEQVQYPEAANEPTATNSPEASKTNDNLEVWVLGDSLVQYAGERAKTTGKDNLGNADIKVIWDGHSSMTVQDLRTAIQHGILRESTEQESPDTALPPPALTDMPERPQLLPKTSNVVKDIMLRKDGAFSWEVEYGKIHERIRDGSVIRSDRNSRYKTTFDTFNSSYPIIGVEWMLEVQRTNVRMEPYYLCRLCEERIIWKKIVTHVNGLRHRISYMGVCYPEMYSFICQKKFTNLAGLRARVDRYAEEITEKEGRKPEPLVLLELDASQTGPHTAGSSQTGSQDFKSLTPLAAPGVSLAQTPFSTRPGYPQHTPHVHQPVLHQPAVPGYQTVISGYPGTMGQKPVGRQDYAVTQSYPSTLTSASSSQQRSTTVSSSLSASAGQHSERAEIQSSQQEHTIEDPIIPDGALIEVSDEEDFCDPDVKDQDDAEVDMPLSEEELQAIEEAYMKRLQEDDDLDELYIDESEEFGLAEEDSPSEPSGMVEISVSLGPSVFEVTNSHIEQPRSSVEIPGLTLVPNIATEVDAQKTEKGKSTTDRSKSVKDSDTKKSSQNKTQNLTAKTEVVKSDKKIKENVSASADKKLSEKKDTEKPSTSKTIDSKNLEGKKSISPKCSTSKLMGKHQFSLKTPVIMLERLSEKAIMQLVPRYAQKSLDKSSKSEQSTSSNTPKAVKSVHPDKLVKEKQKQEVKQQGEDQHALQSKVTSNSNKDPTSNEEKHSQRSSEKSVSKPHHSSTTGIKQSKVKDNLFPKQQPVVTSDRSSADHQKREKNRRDSVKETSVKSMSREKVTEKPKHETHSTTVVQVEMTEISTEGRLRDNTDSDDIENFEEQECDEDFQTFIMAQLGEDFVTVDEFEDDPTEASGTDNVMGTENEKDSGVNKIIKQTDSLGNQIQYTLAEDDERKSGQKETGSEKLKNPEVVEKSSKQTELEEHENKSLLKKPDILDSKFKEDNKNSKPLGVTDADKQKPVMEMSKQETNSSQTVVQVEVTKKSEQTKAETKSDSDQKKDNTKGTLHQQVPEKCKSVTAIEKPKLDISSKTVVPLDLPNISEETKLKHATVKSPKIMDVNKKDPEKSESKKISSVAKQKDVTEKSPHHTPTEVGEKNGKNKQVSEKDKTVVSLMNRENVTEKSKHDTKSETVSQEEQVEHTTQKAVEVKSQEKRDIKDSKHNPVTVRHSSHVQEVFKPEIITSTANEKNRNAKQKLPPTTVIQVELTEIPTEVELITSKDKVKGKIDVKDIKDRPIIEKSKPVGTAVQAPAKSKPEKASSVAKHGNVTDKSQRHTPSEIVVQIELTGLEEETVHTKHKTDVENKEIKQSLEKSKLESPQHSSSEKKTDDSAENKQVKEKYTPEDVTSATETLKQVSSRKTEMPPTQSVAKSFNTANQKDRINIDVIIGTTNEKSVEKTDVGNVKSKTSETPIPCKADGSKHKSETVDNKQDSYDNSKHLSKFENESDKVDDNLVDSIGLQPIGDEDDEFDELVCVDEIEYDDDEEEELTVLDEEEFTVIDEMEDNTNEEVNSDQIKNDNKEAVTPIGEIFDKTDTFTTVDEIQSETSQKSSSDDEASEEMLDQYTTVDEVQDEIDGTTSEEPSRELTGGVVEETLATPSGLKDKDAKQAIPSISKDGDSKQPTPSISKDRDLKQVTPSISKDRDSKQATPTPTISKDRDSKQATASVSKDRDSKQASPSISKDRDSKQATPTPTISKDRDSKQGTASVSKDRDSKWASPSISKDRDSKQATPTPTISKDRDSKQATHSVSKDRDSKQSTPSVSKDRDSKQATPSVSKDRDSKQATPTISKDRDLKQATPSVSKDRDSKEKQDKSPGSSKGNPDTKKQLEKHATFASASKGKSAGDAPCTTNPGKTDSEKTKLETRRDPVSRQSEHPAAHKQFDAPYRRSSPGGSHRSGARRQVMVDVDFQEFDSAAEGLKHKGIQGTVREISRNTQVEIQMTCEEKRTVESKQVVERSASGESSYKPKTHPQCGSRRSYGDGGSHGYSRSGRSHDSHHQGRRPDSSRRHSRQGDRSRSRSRSREDKCQISIEFN